MNKGWEWRRDYDFCALRMYQVLWSSIYILFLFYSFQQPCEAEIVIFMLTCLSLRLSSVAHLQGWHDIYFHFAQAKLMQCYDINFSFSDLL